MSEINITQKRKGAFISALVDAEIGTEIIYSVGLFCSGVHKDPARDAYERGDVVLYQRRKDRVFHYIAKRVK